jgi:uncharacterized alkaline shock family protein YloU
MTTANSPANASVDARDGIPGRAIITARAYEQLVRAVAGEALGVGPHDSSVRLSDAAGRLAIDVDGPIRGDGPPVLERIETARDTIATRVTTLTGAAVERVDIHITRIRFTKGKIR